MELETNSTPPIRLHGVHRNVIFDLYTLCKYYRYVNDLSLQSMQKYFPAPRVYPDGELSLSAHIYNTSDRNSFDKICRTHKKYLTRNKCENVLLATKSHKLVFLCDVYWTVHHCDNWRIKNQLDATYYFIVLLTGSTCFGHYYAHHLELATMMLITTLVVSFLLCCMLEVRCG